MSASAWLCRVAVLSASIAAGVHAAPVSIASQTPDHYEFSGSLNVPFHPDAHGSYPLTLYFDYPGAGSNTLAAWQVDVTDAHGHSVRRWIGEVPMPKQHVQYRLAWDGRDNAGHAVSAGFYTVRMRAVPTVHGKSDFGASLADRVKGAFDLFRSEQEDQSYDVMVGNVPAPKMPVFHALPHGAQAASAKSGAHTQSVPATGSLPYTVYYGNLHSQTNHSDGAGPLATCTGEQNPQSGQYGPPDAYAMMQNQAHGDFLMASEHNHMFDGSTGTNTSANPATAKALFASGLTDMTTYNAAHPGFLALYGVEWGVISNGGHMNIFNADGLPEWEYNSSGQLIGDYYTPKSDYAGIYATMAAHGWIGMFNHPAASGQFNIGGTDLAYDSNGDQVMVLAEVLNSYAFSVNTTQTESELNSYQPAFNILLERGYHVAPASDQDNHCANWGLSSTNPRRRAAADRHHAQRRQFPRRPARPPRVRDRGQDRPADPDRQRQPDGPDDQQQRCTDPGRELRQHQWPDRIARAVFHRRAGQQRHGDAVVRRQRHHHHHAHGRRALLLRADHPGQWQAAVVGADLGQ